jgi:Brp/Blh family beta-carotene 15,15'-monooxygenase
MTLAAAAEIPVRWQSGHRLAALGLTAGLLAVGLWGTPGMTVQLAVLALTVALLGLPHGAVDHLQGRDVLRPRAGGAWPAVFAGLYVGAALAVIGAWALAPPVLLIAFLALAVLHFGAEDVEQDNLLPTRAGRLAEGLLRGAIPVAGPVLFHPAATGQLFSLLTPGTSQQSVFAVLQAAALPATVLLSGASLLMIWAAWRNRGLLAAELGALLLLVAVLPPLLAFAGYFCFWHSPRHSLSVVARIAPEDFRDGLRRFTASAIALTSVTIALAALAWILLDGASQPAAASVQVIFVGLAALTVPHVGLAIASARADWNTDDTPN